MSTRYYPLYQRGNPQLRIFLPNFWMKLIRPDEPLPPNVVLFRTSIQMTKYDVRNYLEKIYKIPVVDVKTTIKMGDIKKILPIGLKRTRLQPRLMKDDDYKEALVYLPKDYKFEFPTICKKQEYEEMKEFRKIKEDLRQSNKNKVPFTPTWFTGCAK